MAPRRVPVSIVCVFNDAEVRRRCLDRSIEEHRDEAPVEYLPIDNTDGSFATAGAALNHGASLASHDYLVFVHQDVYLHSLRALEQRRGCSPTTPASASWALRGHRCRQRVGPHPRPGDPAGRASGRPDDVDSLDEVLFMVPRSLVEREPLSEAARARLARLRDRVRAPRQVAGAARLRARPPAHPQQPHGQPRSARPRLRAVAAAYPEALPVRATCGTVAAPRPRAARCRPPRRPPVALSLAAGVLRRSMPATGGAGVERCVLGDIRIDIDEVIASEPERTAVGRQPRRSSRRISRPAPGPLELVRGSGRRAHVRLPAVRRWRAMVARSDPSTSTLVTNLGIADLRSLDRICLGTTPAGIPQGDRLLAAPRNRGRDGSATTGAPEGDATRDARARLGRPDRLRGPGGDRAQKVLLLRMGRQRPDAGPERERRAPRQAPEQRRRARHRVAEHRDRVGFDIVISRRLEGQPNVLGSKKPT